MEFSNQNNMVHHVNLTLSMVNLTFYQSTVCSSNLTVITRVLYGRMIFSQVDIESNYSTYVDWGVRTTYNNSWSNFYRNFSTIQFNHSKLMVGLTGIRLPTTATIDYLYAVATNPISASGGMQFMAMSASYFYVSTQSCNQATTFKYLYPVDWMCYDVCPAGYYASTPYCLICDISCQQCNGSATLCTICQNGTVMSPPASCATCGISQYLSNGVCIDCPIGCEICDMASCQQCLPDYYSYFGTCYDICPAGYYGNVSTCEPCGALCLYCNSLTDCLACSATTILVNGQCVCDTINGYFFTINNICQPCQSIVSGCVECVDNSTCNQCQIGMVVVGGLCECGGATTLVDGICQYCSTCCNLGYYADVVTLTCVVCMPMCLECQSNSSCTVCDVGTSWNGTSCQCLPGTYLNGLVCSQCLFSNCLQCSQTECLVCGLNSIKNGLQCKCNTSFTMLNGLCTSCRSLMAGCINCLNQMICGACDTSQGYIMADQQCECPIGMYWNSTGVCSNCSDWSYGCTVCGIRGCTRCDSGLGLVLDESRQCLCDIGYYLDSGVCTACGAGCDQCVDSFSCLVCNAVLVWDGVNCVCQAGFIFNGVECICSVGYYAQGSNCAACDGLCLECRGPSNMQCTSCASPAVLNVNTCVCPQGMYQSATPMVCSTCDVKCLNCSSSATSCTACDATTNRVLSGSACVCSAPYADTGSLMCGCDVGFSMANNVCDEVCGDGMLFRLPCDDGNTVSGDGCSADCNIESDFVCRGGNSTAPSECSYNKPIDIVLQKTTKNSTANEVTFQFLVQPPLSSLSGLDFSTCVTTNLTGATLSFQYDSQGILTVVVSYNESIQNADVSLQFAPTVSGSPFFFSTPNSNYNFVVQPDNNQAAVVYPDSVYGQTQLLNYVDMAISALALVGFVLSLFSGKFIGLEMTGVVQVAVIGLVAVDYLHPLLTPLTKVGFVNGYNSALATPSKSRVPARLSALNYCAQMVNSLNFSVALMLLPFLVSLCLYIASKVSKSRQSTLLKHSKTALCEYGMTGVVFVLYNAIVALSVFMFYFEGTASSLFPLSIADAGLTVAALVTVAVLYKLQPEHFGDFKTGFKKDTASQLHYWLVLLFRFVLAVLLVALSEVAFVGFICAGIPLIALIYLAVRRPYSYGYNNARAIFNEVVMLITLAIYGYYRISSFTQHNSSVGNTLPYIAITLLILMISLNFGCMIKYYLDQKNKSKPKPKINLTIDIQKIQQQQNQYLFEQAKNRMKNFAIVKQPNRNMTRYKNLNNTEDMPENNVVDNSMINPNTSIVLKSVKEQLVQNLITKTSQVKIIDGQFSQEEKKEITQQFQDI